MDSRGFGLTRLDVRRLAFQFAVRNYIRVEHFNDQESGMAGDEWLNGFLKSNPDLSIRRAEGLSQARAMGFNRVGVTKYFDLLEKTAEEIGVRNQSSRIFNMDKTWFQLINRVQKVISPKGKCAVFKISNAQKGETVTVVAACNGKRRQRMSYQKAANMA
ncbi:hypothetical protein HOLleu_36474 [Holothuria leucospilota]|uniref:Uncharacterized protein n=1 Tax=Holothuria leucospilota TaxID=206669 RepID=A0A9Q0YK46_HOLLE|nr:hypothetical protein HOLleu_36474 [Holothuria leucospilota]